MGVDSPLLYRLVESVIETFGAIYQDIIDERERTAKVLRIEEERFIKTLQQGVSRLDDVIEDMQKKGSDTIDGGELFKLYDTYGFPLDLARDMALDSGLRIDENGFNQAQKEAARSSWVTADVAVAAAYKDIVKKHGPTVFTGYETLTGSASIVALLKTGSPVQSLSEGDRGEIILDRTPFYGESGGQVGDTGMISSPDARASVTDTKKTPNGLHIHNVIVSKGTFTAGTIVECTVDELERRTIMKNHTATHLLHASLRNVLGEHVKQSGSLVSDEKLRFDFTHFYGLSEDEIADVENLINNVILENRPVRTDVLSIEDALSSGATALFDEKYGDTVRVVSVEGFSKEFCGGTHCKSTGEIGSFVVLSESSVASGIRRIEAVTGLPALNHVRSMKRNLRELSSALKTDNPLEKVQRILDENKALKKEIENLKTSVSGGNGSDILDAVKEINGVKVLAIRQDALSPDEMRSFSDKIKNVLKSGFVFIISVKDDNASMLATVTKDLQKKYHAGNIMKQIASLCGGKGGGSPHMAQGGTRELAHLDKALEMVYDIIKAA